MSPKLLVLHIAVPGIYADDLQDLADEYAEGDVGNLIPEDIKLREEVGLTCVTIPSDGSLNHEFEVHSYNARIVGAEVQETP